MVALSDQAGQRTARAGGTGPWGALCACLVAAGVLSGCSSLVESEAPPPAPQPQAPAQAPEPEVKPPAAPTEPRTEAVPEPGPARVAIVYSGDVPVYGRIADELVSRMPGRVEVVLLRSGTVSEAKLRGADQLVAIGARGARAAGDLKGKPLVFCHAFNFSEYGLTEEHMRGVAMTPPLEPVLAAWKRLVPGGTRIGVITGPGHEGLIARAEEAAHRHGVQLVHRAAHSDQEALFEFKRLVPNIDALWLLPDDRILSHRALRALMAYSGRHGKDVIAFTPALLRFGALMSASAFEEDIADQVMTGLAELSDQDRAGFRLIPLTRARIEVKTGSARRPAQPTATSAVQTGADAH